MDFLTDYEKRYWDSLLNIFDDNEYGVAGLMGNLKAESALIPYRKQGDMGAPTYQASRNYTNGVDNGTISYGSFTGDSVGYGVAQWTTKDRKAKLFDMHAANYLSIGSFELSIMMLDYELNQGGYKAVGNALKTASSVKSASDTVLTRYEMPKDQSEAVKEARYQLSLAIYNKYHGSAPVIPPGPTGNGKKSPVWLYLINPNYL